MVLECVVIFVWIMALNTYVHYCKSLCAADHIQRRIEPHNRKRISSLPQWSWSQRSGTKVEQKVRSLQLAAAYRVNISFRREQPVRSPPLMFSPKESRRFSGVSASIWRTRSRMRHWIAATWRPGQLSQVLTLIHTVCSFMQWWP